MTACQIVAGSRVMCDTTHNMSADLLKLLGLEEGMIYVVTNVEIVPKQTILPAAYIEAGIIPDGYARHLSHGITTTNHDSMGSDRFLGINGKTFSAWYFRLVSES